MRRPVCAGGLVIVTTLAFLIGLGLIPSHALPAAVAAPANSPYCTDWPRASIKDATAAQPTNQDDRMRSYSATVLATLPSFAPEQTPRTMPVPLNVLPAGNDWRVLVRPNKPFAVFYTDTRGNPDVIADTYNEDNDHVPDYVERVLNCLQEAHLRFKDYYQLDPAQENAYIKYMTLEYEVPDADPKKPPLKFSGKFYPVVIRKQSRLGLVEPLLVPQRWDNVFLNTPAGATYMQIDSGHHPDLQRGTAPWLYSGLENTIYHEVAHVYQSVYKLLRNP